jgi:hypothetical protein
MKTKNVGQVPKFSVVVSGELSALIYFFPQLENLQDFSRETVFLYNLRYCAFTFTSWSLESILLSTYSC